MTQDELKSLSDFIGNFDFLFQEGVRFDKEQIREIKNLLQQGLDICDDQLLLTN